VVNLFDMVFMEQNYQFKKGASFLTVVLLINIFLAGFSAMTVTTRIAFAMVRDGALPKSEYFY